MHPSYHCPREHSQRVGATEPRAMTANERAAYFRHLGRIGPPFALFDNFEVIKIFGFER